MRLFFKKIKLAKGTSLLELLVAITLFAVIILSATAIFKMVIDGQRNAIAAQNVQESIRYATERISKEIRTAQIAYRGSAPSERDCRQLFNGTEFNGDDAVNKVYNIQISNLDSNKEALYFKNKDNICVGYFLELDPVTIRNRLKVRIRKVSTGSAFEDFLTPVRTEVSNLKFYVADDLIGAFHSVQPRVLMVMDIKALGPAMHEQKMHVQTTISSRYYE